MVQSNGKSEDPQIQKTFEPLTQDAWIEKDEETGRREITFNEQVREELGIEDLDEEAESN